MPTGSHEARLVDGDKSNEGVLQVLYNGVWATMCNAYDNNNIDFVAVVCRQLGYTGMSKSIANPFGPPEYHPDELLVRRGIPCNGSETHLDQCSSTIDDLEFSFASCGRPYKYECVTGRLD